MKKILLLAAMVSCFINFINAQAGQLDSSFGNNGIVTTDLGDSYTPGKPGVNQIFSLSDGSIYLLDGGISKRRANGLIDSSFGRNGFVSFDAVPYKMAIEPDGKIVAAFSNLEVARFNTDGSLDSGFFKNGKLINDDFQALAIEKDGKIIGVSFDGTSRYYYISRFNTDGSPDTTFSGDGKVTINLDSANSIYIRTVVIQADGKVVVAGARRVGIYNTEVFAVSRYNTNGSLDSSFSKDGIQTTDFGGDRAYLYAAAIQSDGKIVVTGAIGVAYPDFALARYNTDGSPDKSFSGDGKLKTNYSTSYGGQSIAFQPNGKILVSSNRTLIRFNTNGSTDRTIFKNGNFHINSIALQSDGKILAGGNTGADGSYGSYFALARYTADGNFDSTFIGNGLLTDFARAENTGYKKTAVQKDGKIVAAGSYWNGKNFDFAIARYNTDGSADNTFSGDGIQTTYFASDSVKALAIQTDGKIVVAGEHNLARFNADGSLDNTFSDDGNVVTADFIDISSIGIQKDGKIVVAGGQKDKDSYQYDISIPAVARYNPDGTLDKTFGAGGKQVVKGSYYDFDGIASLVVIQNDQKILIAGSLTYTFYGDRGEVDRLDSVVLVRFKINGSLDTTFNHTGKNFFDGGFISEYYDASSCAIAKQNDDKIVITGTIWQNFITGRVNVDGSTDSSFKRIKYAIYDGETYYSVSAMALQYDGKMVVAVSNDTIYRFTADGRFDSTFNSNGRLSPPFAVKDMVITDNKLYIAGGYRYGTVARYLLDDNNTPPTVTLTAPTNNATYLAPAAHIKLSVAASDQDGTITKVEFYNGNTLLHTETAAPYGYVWRNILLGNYTITAKAYDNSGNVTTSATVHISVVPNKAPIVSIISPANNQTYADTATIHLEAAASDTDGRITNVKFYSGTTLLRTEFTPPYTYNWTHAAAGTYTITAVATDNWGARTTSAPVTVIVTSSKAMIVSNKPVTNKTGIKEEISVKLSPNPATSIVNLYTSGLKPNKPANISIISVSGIVLKKVQTSSATQMQLDVSSLAKGVYTIKIVSGEKVLLKQFVKL